MAFQCSYFLEPVETSRLPQRFLDAFAAVLRHTNYAPMLDVAARTTARCARCTVACQVWQASGEDRDIPCHRSELLLRIYRRYFTPFGVIASKFGGGFELDEDYINRLAEEYYRCTGCRRCTLECPMGIDHGLIVHLGRWLLAEVGIVPKALRVAVREQLEGKTRNTSAIPVAALVDTCEFLEEEGRDDYGIDIKFPIDVEGAEYLFLPAVSDYLLEAETLIGNAAVMRATQGSWTIGTGFFDGINYGLFYSDRWHERIVQCAVEELRRLKAKKILIGECGHASRAAHDFIRTYGGPDAPEVVNCMEYAAQALRDGRLPLKRGAIKERVTYHDPCNISRSGWIREQPREILRYIAEDFVEMIPNRGENYCCGGGGGTVSIDEIRPFRTGIAGKTKAEQIRRTGAALVVAPCANCKEQLREVCEDNGLEHVRVVGLHDLIVKALIPPDFMKVGERADG